MFPICFGEEKKLTLLYPRLHTKILNIILEKKGLLSSGGTLTFRVVVLSLMRSTGNSLCEYFSVCKAYRTPSQIENIFYKRQKVCLAQLIVCLTLRIVGSNPTLGVSF